jgi:hypothetical protein
MIAGQRTEAAPTNCVSGFPEDPSTASRVQLTYGLNRGALLKGSRVPRNKARSDERGFRL